MITGKSKNFGGISCIRTGTGLGLYFVTRQVLENSEMVKKLGITQGIKGKTFIVEGFGNVGYWASKFFV